jgi:hypothetical protein
MALILNISLQQTQDSTQIYLFDTTGQYGTANLGGWGSPNQATNTVAFTTLSVTITPLGDIAPTTYPIINVFPTLSNPSPYVFNESYILTPSLIGLSSTLFPNGIYNLTYTVNCSYYTANYSSYTGTINVGNTIYKGTLIHEVVGIVLSIGGGTITIQPTYGSTVINNGDTLYVGDVFFPTGSLIVSDVVLTSVIYTVAKSFKINNGLICCIGNLLSGMDCCCDCQSFESLWQNFMYLVGSQAQIGCNKNGEALQSMSCVNNYCLQNKCNCGCT